MSYVKTYESFLAEKKSEAELNEFFSSNPSPVAIIKKLLTSVSMDKFKELMRKNDQFFSAVYHAIEDELMDSPKEFDNVWNKGGDPARFEFIKNLLK
jgi:hypothetical protein